MPDEQITARVLHAQRGERGRIGKQHQIALVGIQRMRPRLRRDDHGIGKIRLAQGGGVCGLEIKIGQPVIDQIDALLTVPERAPTKDQRLGRHDQRGAARRGEQSLEKLELGIKILTLGRFIDDRHRARKVGVGGTASLFPFGAEHGDQRDLERRAARRTGDELRDVGATGLLCRVEQGNQQTATGIGVDFDELWPLRAEMEVETEKGATIGHHLPRDRRRLFEHLRRVSRPCHHRLDGGNHFRDAPGFGFADEHHRFGE